MSTFSNGYRKAATLSPASVGSHDAASTLDPLGRLHSSSATAFDASSHALGRLPSFPEAPASSGTSWRGQKLV